MKKIYDDWMVDIPDKYKDAKIIRVMKTYQNVNGKSVDRLRILCEWEEPEIINDPRTHQLESMKSPIEEARE